MRHLVSIALILSTFLLHACKARTPSSQLAGDSSEVNAQAKDGSPDVIIVGAGLTGLTTAYQLNKVGVRSLVLEAQDRIGGRIETMVMDDGTTAESHMEEYFERNPACDLLRELKLPLIVDVPHSSVRIDGKVYLNKGDADGILANDGRGEPGGSARYRETYLDGMFNAEEKQAFTEWNVKVWALYEKLRDSFFKGRPLPQELVALQKISFKEFVERDRLPRKVSEWIRVTVEPEIAVEWEKIAALDGVDEMRLFIDSPDGFGEKNSHVEGGNSKFIDAIAAKLPADSIRRLSRVTKVSQTNDKVTVQYTSEGKTLSATAAYAVVTVPLSVINRIEFEPALDADKQRAIATTRFGSYLKVHYRMDPAVRPILDRYGPDLFTFLSDSPAGSIYNVTDFGTAKPGQILTITNLVHAGYSRDLMKDTASSPDQKAEVAKRSAAAIEALFPGFSSHIKETFTFLYPTGIAYWPFAEGRSRFDALAEHLRKPQGRLFIGGDTTENSHSEGAVEAALRMSGKIAMELKGLEPPHPVAPLD